MATSTTSDHKHEIFKSTATVFLDLAPTTNDDTDGDDDIVILRRDPATRKGVINKQAYLKLHRSLSADKDGAIKRRNSVDNIKGKYEQWPQDVVINKLNNGRGSTVTNQLNFDQIEFLKTKYSPDNFKCSQNKPVPKPRLLKVASDSAKDENSNKLSSSGGGKKPEESLDRLSDHETRIIVRPSKSQESIDKIAHELSYFTMEKRGKEKKRTSSFRKLFGGGFFGKDKKKKEQDERGKGKIHNDNVQNETFNRQSPHRHTIAATNIQKNDAHTYSNHSVILEQQEMYEQRARELEKQYAEMHINRFNQIRQNFTNQKTEDYLPMDNTFHKTNRKPTISDYISIPVQKYIDTSSSTTISEPDKQYQPNGGAPEENRDPNFRDVYRQTPPRAQETYQNFKLIKPKATIPINSERPLPLPYQNNVNFAAHHSKTSPRTIERNLNKSNNKDYPDKSSDLIGAPRPALDDTYGTVFDSLEYISSRNGELKPVNSSQNERTIFSPTPKSPSLESTKLKLPPNREIIDLQPRVKSPIPANCVSAEKIIATELLRNSCSPTPSKKKNSCSSPQQLDPASNYSSLAKAKPPMSPKNVPASSNNSSMGSSDKITTSAEVHVSSPTTKPSQMPNEVELREQPPSPVNRSQSRLSAPMSPQKEDMRKSVEAYYWKELKRMKEQQDYDLYMMQMSINGFLEDAPKVRRSRSLSPGMQRMGRKSLSLPREVRPVLQQQNEYVESPYGRMPPAIPEGQPLNITESTARRTLTYGPAYQSNFQRNNASVDRSTISCVGPKLADEYATMESLYRPIFRRGSLSRRDMPEPQNNANKKVSFTRNAHNFPAMWPTKNGFTMSPPQRRLQEQPRNGSLDGNAFLLNVAQSDHLYGQVHRMPENYAHMTDLYGSRQNSFSSSGQAPFLQSFSESVEPQYLRQGGGNQRSAKGPLQRREIVIKDDIYGQFAGYQLPPKTPNSVYSSRQSVAESVYGYAGSGKQITVTNRVCDMYGQIHDTGGSTGVLMGRLQRSPLAPRQNFVRGSRLTASANDMGRRAALDAHFRAEPLPDSRRHPRPVQGEAPARPLPPIPHKKAITAVSDTESGSDASEVQRIMLGNGNNRGKLSKKRGFFDEEWSADGKSSRNTGNDSGRSDNEGGEVRGRSRTTRRDDPRRHTLGGDQQYPMAGQGGQLARTMDLEGQPRGYPPPSNAMLFDDDPGIMSEVETSSTGFRRGGKQRSSLPVVRTPSKTLERPLGLVFLQYRNETKRALLPNEITSIDTVKALFVRSFPKQLTMEYLDSPNVKIYIHDSSKDMFYELEDLRSHLREIRDRSVLRLFESADVSGGLPMAGIGIAGGVGHFEDPSYFSEPEFDSEYQHQHIHKSKASAGKAPYYMGSTASLPRGAALLRTYSPAVGARPADHLKPLPTGAPPKPQRAYSSGSSRSGGEGAPRPPDRFVPFQRPANPLFTVPDGYMSSPERGSRYEDPYYSQYAPRSGSITPVIDEEISDTELLDDSYSLYGVKLPPGGPRVASRSPFAPAAAVPYDATRLRVENMERQLANLTGLVQKALTQTPSPHLQVPGRDGYRPDKSVSFEKSVSFSDEPPDMNSPKQHSPQHAERDRLKPAPPPKPASLSPGQYDNRLLYRDLQLTPEMYNQLRGLQKKAKDLRAEVRNLRRMSQAQAHSVRETIRDAFIKIRTMLLVGGEQVWQAGMDQERVRLSREEDLYKQEMLRLEKDLTDLESTVEELRGNVINRKTRVNMSDVENMALILSKSSKTVADLKLRFPGLQDGMKTFLSTEMEKVMREEKFLKEEPERLESALRRCKKLTGTLVTLKRLASVQEQRLPCSTSAGEGRMSPPPAEAPTITPPPPSQHHSKPPAGPCVGAVVVGGDGAGSFDGNQRPENALDALLDELQTFAKPHAAADGGEAPPAIPAKGVAPHMTDVGRKGSADSAAPLAVQGAAASLRRLHSYPSGSDTDNSPPIQLPARGKPPLPERNADLLQHISASRRIPPPPPPRTSSKSPLASPTSPGLPPRAAPLSLQHIQNVQSMSDGKPQLEAAAAQGAGLGGTMRRNAPVTRTLSGDRAQTLPRNIGSNLQAAPEGNEISASNSSSCESVNSQDGTKKTRKEELEQRHQELLRKQRALQEQYARLQQLQRGANALAVVPPTAELLKKTGSESNLLQKMGLHMAPSQMTGSLTNLPNTAANVLSKSAIVVQPLQNNREDAISATVTTTTTTTTNKVYETDIL